MVTEPLDVLTDLAVLFTFSLAQVCVRSVSVAVSPDPLEFKNSFGANYYVCTTVPNIIQQYHAWGHAVGATL